MSSQLPANATQLQHDTSDGSPSEERAISIARLSSSPALRYSSSPKESIAGDFANDISNDLDLVLPGSSNLMRPMSTPTYHEDGTVSVGLRDEQMARVVKRHLADAASGSSSPKSGSDLSRQLSSDDGFTSVHQLPGSAITHEIYKWVEHVDNEAARRQRSQSFAAPSADPDPSLVQLRAPGGFRRHYVFDKAEKEGKELRTWVPKTFVDFLVLFGHFGGEDLRDDEDDDDDDLMHDAEAGSSGLRRRRYGGWGGDDHREPTEESPLIRRAQASAIQGTASPTKAVFLLLKSFVGTGVMFLPKAFHNGGLLFSTLLLSAIACISLYSFLLLVETRNRVPVSFGDIGGILFGPRMRMAVLIAITFSQVGFVCAYMVFVAQNVQALIEALSNCDVRLSLTWLILGQLFIFVPLSMIRKIQKLSSFALIADLFILIGLVYLYYYDFITLAAQGVADVEWTINKSSFPMFIGTAVFTYEGVGLVIPITESMKEPRKFPKVLSWTMAFITLIFLSVGFVSYLAFGSKVQTVILLNMPATPMVNTVQGLYALAICLSIPLQLFPAIRIAENALFSRSGKYNPIVKWQKNMFRFLAVLICSAIAIGGSGDLDKFVSLVGALCCVPLCFIFPPLFHYKSIAQTWRQKTIDLSIVLLGIVFMTYTTIITIVLWTSGGEGAPITRCTPSGN